MLVESPARRTPDQLYGKTPQFKAIVFPNDGTPAGTLKRARVIGSTPVTLFGETRAATPAEPTLVTLG